MIPLLNPPHLTICISSHNFSVSRLSPRGRDICVEFARRFLAYKWESHRGQFLRVPAKVYASRTADNSVFRFHINSLPDFQRLLADRQMTGHLVSWNNAREYEPFKFEYKLRPEWKPRDYQIPAIDYLCRDKPIAKLVEFQTGDGKGLTSMFAIERRGERVVGVLKPKYIEKWQEEFIKTFANLDDSIVTVQGSKELKALLILAAEGALNDAIILISNATYRNWISEYEDYGPDILDRGYSCLPEDLFLHLQTGTRLIDENHEDFHFFFKLDTYTHVKSSISLTATLVSNDPTIKRMHELMFPYNQRMEKRQLHRYADVYAVAYQFKAPEKIRTTEYGQSTYSHTAFEKSLLKHLPTLRNYLNLIKWVLDNQYIHGRKPGERALVYAGSIAMCTKIVEFLKTCYPSLDIRRKVEDDPYENAVEPDICVSTLLSTGTAYDIPNLAVVLMTTAVQSVQSNIQALGRLRKREGEKTQFLFTFAENIPKHVEYAEQKRELFKDRARNFNLMPSGFAV